MKSFIVLSIAVLYVLILSAFPCFTPYPPPPKPHMMHPPAFMATAQPVWEPKLQRWYWVGLNHCMPSRSEVLRKP